MREYLADIRRTLSLALPMIIGQLTGMAMAMTDQAMVGRGVGTESLAALAFALNFTNIPYISLYGLVNAMAITIAQVYGARQYARMPGVLRHGMVLTLAFSIVVICGMLIFLSQLDKVNYLGQDPALLPIARPYIIYFSLAFIMILMGSCLRAYCESQNRPWTPLFFVLGAVGLNVLLNWIFIFGNLGAPAMGLAGAGLGTLLSNVVLFFAILFVTTRYERYNLPLRELLKPRLRWAQFRHLLGIGIPTSTQIAVEVGAFSIAALLMGSISPIALAAHQVSIQVAAFSFMIPLGVSFAVSIRVGQAGGAGEMGRVRRIGVSALVTVGIWMFVASTAIMALRHYLPLAFTQDAEVIRLAGSFLVITALFQLFDGLQVTATGALRGLRDTRMPTIFVACDYWLFCLPLAWFLAFRAGFGGIGIWMALLLGLFGAAIVLVTRFWIISGRDAPPALLLADDEADETALPPVPPA